MMYVRADGTKMTFPEVVAAILVEENGRTQEEADLLVKKYPQVVMNGIMGGMAFRATALALKMKEEQDATADAAKEK